MAKQFYLYGSSPDALANSQFGYDQFFTRTAEGNRAASADAQRFNIQAFLQAQAADEAARERDAAMRANMFQNQAAQRMAAEQAGYARSVDARNFAAQNEERARRNWFQDTFIVPEAQQKIERARLENDFLKNAPVEEQSNRALKVRDFVAKYPANPETIDPKQIAANFRVPEAEVAAILKPASEEFAYNQAAQLNQMFNARLYQIANPKGAGAVPVEITPEIKQQVRNAVESEAGRMHKDVRFDPEAGAFVVGKNASGGGSSQAPVKRYTLVNGQLQLQ